MNPMTSIFTAILILLALPGRAGPSGLVRNGDFSRAEGERPAGWEVSGDPQQVDQTLRVALDRGNPCAHLRCTRIQGAGGSVHAMIAQVGAIRLGKGRVYELTCRARAAGVASRSVQVAVKDTSGWEGCGLDAGLALGRQWRRFRIVFRAARDVWETGRLQFWFTETGALYLDDVKIEEIRAGDVAFTDIAPTTGGKNLLHNGSFEAGSSGWGSLGLWAGWGNMAHLHGQILSGPRGRFLRIPLGDDRTPVLYFDYLKPVAIRQTRLLAASRGWISVERGSPYTFSCLLRASREGVRARIGVITADPEDDSGSRITLDSAVTLSTAWRRYDFSFTPNKRYVFVIAGPDLDSEEGRVSVDLDEAQLERGSRATPFTPGNPVEVGVEPDREGGVWTTIEHPSLRIKARNYRPVPVTVRVAFSAADYFDRPDRLSPLTLRIPAVSSAEKRLLLPRRWRGFYRVRARWSATGRSGSCALRLAVVPAPTGEDSVLGINHAFPDRYLIRLARRSGVTWYRDWSLKWEDTEPAPGRWNWEMADTQIGRMLREGVHVLPILPPFPSAEWSSEASEDIPREGYPGARIRQAWAPKDPELLADFIGRAVARYRDRIRTWEFLNEPLYTSYSLPGEAVRDYPGRRYKPEDYVRLLKRAASAMRASDPGCRVIGGLGSDPEHLTSELMEAGILEAIDGFNLHIYPGTRAPEGYIAPMERFLKEMEKQGGRKPVWITEFAYYADDHLPRRPFVPAEGNWAEERLLASERECAEYTVRFFALMLSRGVEKIFLHSGASGSINDPSAECPLFSWGGAPRRLLPALGVFTHLAGPHPRPALERPLGGEGRLVAFETGSRSLLVLWEPFGEGRRVSVQARGVRILDLMGREQAGKSFRLSSAPLYILGPPGRAREVAASVAPVKYEGE